MNRPGFAMALAAFAVLTAAPLWCQYDRAVLPLNRVHLKHQVDSAAGMSAYRLQPVRMEGSRLGTADVTVELLRVDRTKGVVNTFYQVMITIRDSIILGLEYGGSLKLIIDGKTIDLNKADGDVRILNAPGAVRPPAMVPAERYRTTFEEVAWYDIKAADLIALALAPKIEVWITGQKGRLVRFIQGSALDQFRGFVVYHVEGAPKPAPENPG